MGRQDRASKGWFTRVRALLAGALVLGVGGSLTLAAWTDDEYANAGFVAGTFGIVGSTNGSTFSEHPATGSAAALAFTLPTSTQLVPGSVVYAPFTVRTVPGSVAGAVQFTAASTNSAGLGVYLTYGVRVITGTTCNATTFGAGTAVVATGSALTVGATAARPVAANAATPITYCLQVTLPASTPNAAQGLALTARWQVAATTEPTG